MTAMLDGKVALVTGGGSGVGRATALAFARAGAGLIVSDVDDAGGEDTVARISGEGGHAVYHHADATEPAGVQAIRSGTLSRCWARRPR